MAKSKAPRKKYSNDKAIQDEMNRRSAEAQAAVDRECDALFKEFGFDMKDYQTEIMKKGYRLVMEYMPDHSGVILNMCKIEKSRVVIFKKYA